jgi:alcohol dehydrogenase class IV
MQFTIRSPREVIFGWGAISGLPKAAAAVGLRPLVVVGGGALRRAGTLDAILNGLASAGLEAALFEGVEHDPSLETIDRGREVFVRERCDLVVAVGGGSALDAGKAIAGLAGEAASTREFQDGKPVPVQGPPIIACPTTSGTGSEVTHVSVLTDPSRRLKASIRGESMMPAVALVDPELTVSLPPEPTAHTGLDAFTQAVESYVSVGANPFSDPLALEAATRIGKFLRAAYRDGNARKAREEMALGSMLAGLALASARLGLVHGIAPPLGALYGLEHGRACAVLLPHVMEFNADASETKFAALARALGIAHGGNDTLAACRLIVWTRELCAELGCLAPFHTFGLKREDYPTIVEATMASGSTKANPRPVTEAEVVRLLDAAM